MSNYKYRAYNLNFASCIPIPQLQVSTSEQTDVTISMGKIDWDPPKELPQHRCWYIDGEDVYFYWQFSGKYLLKGGKEIIIEPLPEVDSNHIIGIPLRAAVMGMLLQQRGHLILHASAIKIGHEACVFLGCKGQGKSTMAATLYNRGNQSLADDIAAVTFNSDGEAILLSGFPQIKLWPDSVTAALGNEDPSSLPEVYPNAAKRACPTFDNFHPQSLPLKRIYILGSAEQPEIKPMSVQEAIKHLVGNSYIPMTLGKDFVDSGFSSKHFQDCTKVIRKVDICSLNRPRSLDLLPEVARLVEQDMAPEHCLKAAS